MIIQNERCVLRSFSKEDLGVFYLMAHDEAVKRYVPFAYPADEEEAKEMISTYEEGDFKNDFYLMIEKDGMPVGVIIAIRTINAVLDTSAFIARGYRGKGIMTDALRLFISYLKANTKIKELRMEIEFENLASNMQISKIGGECICIFTNYKVYRVKVN